MKLNVGAGDDRKAGYVHLDVRTDCHPDVAGDAARLPFQDQTFEEVRAFDVLEHFPRRQRFPVLLEWHRVLRPGGRLIVRVPNMHALAAQIQFWADKPGPQLEMLLDNVYGGHKYGPDGIWDTHHWGYTPASLAVTLGTAGFVTESISDSLNMTAVGVAT